jgi:hypothetical protein
VFRHRSATAAVALAASVALIPGTAFAAGSTSGKAKTVPETTANPSTSTSASAKALRTYASPASKSIRLQKPEITSSAATGAGETAQVTASSATTIYVAAYSGAICTDGTGAGTAATPWCSIQNAVDAAVSGDTVDVLGSQGSFSTESVTVSTSGISIVGVGNQAWDMAQSGSPAFILNGVSHVTISNLMLNGAGTGIPAVEILGSSNVTLDSDYIQGGYAGVNPNGTGVEIDGSSDNVTVSRTYVNTGTSAPSDSGIAIESGASGITLAGDILASAGIVATGVTGLDVAGNTIQRGCDAAIDIEGTSTSVSLQNNLIEDANPNTDSYLGGYRSQCQADSATWAPDITVASAATAGTTTDYNDFYVYGTDGTAEYDWAGSTYSTLAAFRTTGQGSADKLDTVEANSAAFRPNAVSDVDANLVGGSSAIASANSSAPGELSTDFYGDSPYTSRGAIQYNSRNQTLAVSLKVVDTSAKGIQLTSTVTSAAGYTLEPKVTWGDGNYDFESFYNNSLDLTYNYRSLGTYTVSITVTDGEGDAVTNSVVVTTAGTSYTAYGPTRLLDTRKGTGTGGVIAPVAANGTLKLKIAGNGSIPADAWAAALNLTVTNPKAGGNLTAYPDGLSVPITSNVNFGAKQTVANMAVVAVGDDGYVDLRNNSSGTVDLVVDISGYYTPTSAGKGYTAITPARFLDTRNGTGGYPSKTVSPGHPVTLKIDGRFTVPSSAVAAVAINITEASPSGSGYITAWSGGTEPTASNLNFTTGETRAASAIVPVSSSGTINLAYTGTGSARLIVDVDGYYSSTGSSYVPVVPYRYLDSRTIKNGALPSGYYYELGLGSYGTLGPDTITGVIANTTVTSTTGAGDLVVFPNANYSSDEPVTVPTTSALNFTKGTTVPNLTFVTPGYGGDEDFYNQSTGSLQLIVDVMGYFMAS